MKKTSLMTLVVCLAAVIGAASASAQTPGLRLSLPYAVTVGNVTLPAGACTVTDIQDNGHETFFVIRSASGPAVDVMMERDDSSYSLDAAPSAIELRRAGDKYELARVRIEGRGYKVTE